MQQNSYFQNKNILIISPNPWGKIYISKHHYAIELARLGNNVYFLEPVVHSAAEKTTITQPLNELPNLHVVSSRVPRYYDLLRFKWRPVYDWLIRRKIRKLVHQLGRKIDVLWCFETNLYSDLSWFNGYFTIFHPVDPMLYAFQTHIAASADIVLTVSDSILKSVQAFNKHSYIVNHGLNKEFADVATKRLASLNGADKSMQARVGFIGNLLRPEVNAGCIAKLISHYPDVQFHFWSPLESGHSNISADDNASTRNLVALLRQSSNVILHGIKPSAELAATLPLMDVLILPLQKTHKYDCSNSHKLIEYLSTGKTIVANHISTYNNSPLLEMAASDNTDEVLAKFSEVINDLPKFNSTDNQQARIAFALDNTYINHINKISELISISAN